MGLVVDLRERGLVGEPARVEELAVLRGEREPDVTLLTPVGGPRVPDGDVVLLRVRALRAGAHELHAVVEVVRGVAAASPQNAARVRLPHGGVDADRRRALYLSVGQQPLNVLRVARPFVARRRRVLVTSDLGNNRLPVEVAPPGVAPAGGVRVLRKRRERERERD